MSKGPRKSILANFASFAAEAKVHAGEAAAKTNAGDDALAPVPSPSAGGAPSATRSATAPMGGMVQRVGASVIGATQRSIAELREERDQLRVLVDAGGVREIDASLVDPSHFRDRMPDDDDADFEGFRARFAQEGQKVPAEVRVHPDVPGRFQLVFGHRRWRAARELGVPLRAIVVAKSDVEVAVSQGIENAERQDLSWIERARFAATLDQAGLKARDIRAALGIDDPELARFRMVLRALPSEVIEAIGRAPKAGRPRWVEMAKLADEFPARVALLTKTLADVRSMTSEERIQAVLTLLRGQPATGGEPLELRASDGQLLAQVRLMGGTMQLTAVRSVASELNAFLREDLPHMTERFERWKTARQVR